jgi:hypothetical protein
MKKNINNKIYVLNMRSLDLVITLAHYLGKFMVVSNDKFIPEPSLWNLIWILGFGIIYPLKHVVSWPMLTSICKHIR